MEPVELRKHNPIKRLMILCFIISFSDTFDTMNVREGII